MVWSPFQVLNLYFVSSSWDLSKCLQRDVDAIKGGNRKADKQNYQRDNKASLTVWNIPAKKEFPVCSATSKGLQQAAPAEPKFHRYLV